MAAFDFAKVKDPTFFKENVLNAHASFRTYASREEYRTGSSSLALKLDGIWKFAYAKNYTSAIPGFEKTDYDCSGWDDIHVPAHIQMEGYDIPQYANVQYPWDGREEVQPGEIPQRFNPVASYVKYFELPESMQGKPVHIEFEGVESGMALWLNGSYVGYTEDSFSAHAFDLTPSPASSAACGCTPSPPCIWEMYPSRRCLPGMILRIPRWKLHCRWRARVQPV